MKEKSQNNIAFYAFWFFSSFKYWTNASLFQLFCGTKKKKSLTKPKLISNIHKKKSRLILFLYGFSFNSEKQQEKRMESEMKKKSYQIVENRQEQEVNEAVILLPPFKHFFYVYVSYNRMLFFFLHQLYDYFLCNEHIHFYTHSTCKQSAYISIKWK